MKSTLAPWVSQVASPESAGIASSPTGGKPPACAWWTSEATMEGGRDGVLPDGQREVCFIMILYIFFAATAGGWGISCSGSSVFVFCSSKGWGVWPFFFRVEVV